MKKWKKVFVDSVFSDVSKILKMGLIEWLKSFGVILYPR